jgi:MFS family permease
VSAPAAFLPARFAGYRPLRRKMSPSRSNVVLVIVLGAMTMSGSSLFVFAATLATAELGMAAGVVSLSYSANALAGLIGARRHADDRLRPLWTFGIALSAAAVGFGGAPILFVAGLVAWGFCFWMATPNILTAIAAWSLAPDERVGDAQSAMAVGRAAGPAVASVLVADGSFDALGAFAVVGLTLSAVAIAVVARHRRSHPNPAAAHAA